MEILASVRIVCTRLVNSGWNEVLLKHGLDLEDALAQDDSEFARRLSADLNIDRNVAGFDDYSTAGRSAIGAGRPAASLLYHAMASSHAHPDGSDLAGDPAVYPTLEELDTIENYVYSKQSVDLSRLRNPVIAVFAYQYRSGAYSPHRQHADFAYSRCGVARVGTAPPEYDPVNRDFDTSGSAGTIRALPAHYAAFIAENTTPTNSDPIFARQRGDHRRNFAFPVHKLFAGTDCMVGADLTVDFSEFHRNDKLRRVHAEGGVRVVDGFDIDIYPFVRDSENAGDLIRLENSGASVSVVPLENDELVRTAEQFNNLTGHVEIVRFHVPAETASNRYATSLSIPGDRVNGARHAPEYVNIRHKVERTAGTLRVVDMKALPEVEFGRQIRQGNYEAAHYIDDSCDGVLSVEVGGMPQIDGASTWSVLPAYSLVTAPDFLPISDQIEIAAWSRLSSRNSDDQFSQGRPDPLCEGRRAVNPFLPHPGRNSKAFARTEESVVAIVATPSLSSGQGAGGSKRAFTSHLTDAASNEFAPGWDVSLDAKDGILFYASYGLGSPFPEDAKLCAALNSFWPAVAPDASRTFGVEFSPTAIPMLDVELGYHPLHPAVIQGIVPSNVGWDGEYGPFFEDVGGTEHVNYTSLNRSDYVTNALARTINTGQTDAITAHDLIYRMEALQSCIYSLPPPDDKVSETRLWLVRAELVADWLQKTDAADAKLTGNGFVFEFAEVEGNPLRDGTPDSDDASRLRIRVEQRTVCHVSGSLLFFRLSGGNNSWKAGKR